MSMRSFGSALQDATGTFFKLRDQRLDRERQARIDAQNQETHDLQMKQLQLALEDRPRDLAWEQASRISQALGPEDAFNNTGYLEALKRAGVNVPQGTPGKFLMAAPDMADGSQGIGPQDLTPDTGVTLPDSVRIKRAQDTAALQKAELMNKFLAQAGQNAQGGDMSDNPGARMAFVASGMNPNEIFGPPDKDPNLVKFSKQEEIRGQMRKKYHVGGSSGSGDDIKTAQYAARIEAITQAANANAAKLFPMPGEGSDPASQIAAVKLMKQGPGMMEAARQATIAKREQYVQQYTSANAKRQGLKDPYTAETPTPTKPPKPPLTTADKPAGKYSGGVIATSSTQ